MSRDFDNIRKKIDQSHKELYDTNNPDNTKIIKEISDIKKEVKDIAFKVDMMLEILNNFSIMLVEDDEDLEDNYSDDQSWVPEQDEDWNTYKDNDE